MGGGAARGASRHGGEINVVQVCCRYRKVCPNVSGAATRQGVTHDKPLLSVANVRYVTPLRPTPRSSARRRSQPVASLPACATGKCLQPQWDAPPRSRSSACPRSPRTRRWAATRRNRKAPRAARSKRQHRRSRRRRRRPSSKATPFKANCQRRLEISLSLSLARNCSGSRDTHRRHTHIRHGHTAAH